MRPQRIQRSRAAGWRMPSGAVYVGRGSKWGNPFRVGDMGTGGRPMTAGEVVATYRKWVTSNLANFRQSDIEGLRGKDLACWCPLDQPCHADVLLELANGNQR